jgi:hypothetical protein
MNGNLRFAVFMIVAFVVFVFILRFVLRRRTEHPSSMRVITTALVVVAGGMLFARVGQNSGLPWWIYYTIPLLVTVAVPPAVFRMNSREVLAYLVLAFLSSPVIHVVFSFFLGWNEYMPFIEIPAMGEL